MTETDLVIVKHTGVLTMIRLLGIRAPVLILTPPRIVLIYDPSELVSATLGVSGSIQPLDTLLSDAEKNYFLNFIMLFF